MNKRWLVGLVSLFALAGCTDLVPKKADPVDPQLAWKDGLSLTKVYDGEAVTLPTDAYTTLTTATPEVTWYAGESLLAESPVNVGEYSVKVSVAATEAYLAGSIEMDFEITKAARTVAFPEGYDPSKTYDGQPVVAPTVAADIVITWYDGDGEEMNSAPINAGEYKVALDLAGDANHTAAHAEKQFAIAKAQLPAPTVSESYVAEKVYDNAPAVAPEVDAGVEVEWYEGETLLDGAPKAALPENGKYTIKLINRATDSNHADGVTTVEYQIKPLESDGSYNYGYTSLNGLEIPEGKDLMNIRVGIVGLPTEDVEWAAVQHLVFVGTAKGTAYNWESGIVGGEKIKQYKSMAFLDMALPLNFTGTTITNLRHIGGSVANKIIFEILDINFSQTAANDLAFVENVSLDKVYDNCAVELPALDADLFTTSSTGKITKTWKQGDTVLEEAPVDVGSYSLVISQQISQEYCAKEITLPVTISPICVGGEGVIVDQFAKAETLVGNGMNILEVYARRADVEENADSINVGFKVNGVNENEEAFVAHAYAVEETALTGSDIVKYELKLTQDRFTLGNIEVTTDPTSGKIDIMKIDFSRDLIKFNKSYNPSRAYNMLPIADPVLGTDYVTPNEGAVTVEWYEGETKLESAPVIAGTYKVVLTQGTDVVEKEFTISPKSTDIGDNSGSAVQLNLAPNNNLHVPAGCSKLRIKYGLSEGAANTQLWFKFCAKNSYTVAGQTGWKETWFEPGSGGYIRTSTGGKTYTDEIVFGGQGDFYIYDFYTLKSCKTEGATFDVYSIEFVVAPLEFAADVSFDKTFDLTAAKTPVVGTDYYTKDGEAATIEWYQGDTKLDNAPVAAGTYKVKLVKGENSVEKEFTISPAEFDVGMTATSYQFNTGIIKSDIHVPAGCNSVRIYAKNIETAWVNVQVYFLFYAKNSYTVSDHPVTESIGWDGSIFKCFDTLYSGQVKTFEFEMGGSGDFYINQLNSFQVKNDVSARIQVTGIEFFTK